MRIISVKLKILNLLLVTNKNFIFHSLINKSWLACLFYWRNGVNHINIRLAFFQEKGFNKEWKIDKWSLLPSIQLPFKVVDVRFDEKRASHNNETELINTHCSFSYGRRISKIIIYPSQCTNRILCICICT